MSYLAGIAIGFIAGLLVRKLIFVSKCVGDLRVCNSDESSSPYLFLELRNGVSDISRRRYVLLCVKNEEYTTRR